MLTPEPIIFLASTMCRLSASFVPPSTMNIEKGIAPRSLPLALFLYQRATEIQ
jgi:hypothetical protein